jgi:class 3 adenylate cyclase
LAPERSERRLAAVMFTDIVGYTAITARDEETGRRVRDRHGATLRPLIERYHGQWIGATGDESLSTYPNALDAVNRALVIQEALRDDPELEVRIGIHLGDVTFEQGSVFGDGVNVASRIRPLAEPGGVCISDAVHRSVRGHRNFGFRPLGEQELKNVDRPVAVFAVTGTASPPSSTSAARRGRETRTGLRAALFLGALMVLALATWMLNRGVTDPALIRSMGMSRSLLTL